METTDLKRLPRLCFLGYRQLREFAAPVVLEYAERADIELVELQLDGGTPEVPLAERVARAMRLAQGNRGRAAQILGVSRSTLWRWLREEPAAFEETEDTEVAGSIRQLGND